MLNEIVLLCSIYYGRFYGVSPKLIQAIAQVESNTNPAAKSPDKKDIGLMQIRAEYVPETVAELLDTCTSIRVGARILAEVKKKCVHKRNYTYVVCYNRGIYGAQKVKYPEKDRYYKQVLKKLRSINEKFNHNLQEFGEAVYRSRSPVPHR